MVFCNVIRLKLMSSISTGCGVLALLSVARGAIYCGRTVHVYLRVDTVPCRRLFPSSACIVHQWPSLDFSTDGTSA